MIPSIREFTKPLFSIPTHQFLFNAGQINPKEYMDALQVEPSEFELIKYPKEEPVCTVAETNDIYCRSLLPITNLRCSERQAGANECYSCRCTKKSRGICSY